MLVLSRREGEKLVFPNLGITLEVLRVRGNATRLGIRAPSNVAVLREELCPEGGSEPAVSAAPELSAMRKLSHAVRNRLHAATLALHLFRKQLDRGLAEEAEQTWLKILEELVALEGEAAPQPKKPASTRAERTCRTLVVEDDANECELLAGFLRVSGFEVATSGDGAAALDYLSSHELPDVILLDMIMPRLDGRATIGKIRQNPHLASLKVFAISGTSPSEFGVPTGPKGIDRWFPKPVNPEELVREIAREVRDT
jgi:carbon storage regulator CsrA